MPAATRDPETGKFVAATPEPAPTEIPPAATPEPAKGKVDVSALSDWISKDLAKTQPEPAPAAEGGTPAEIAPEDPEKTPKKVTPEKSTPTPAPKKPAPKVVPKTPPAAAPLTAEQIASAAAEGVARAFPKPAAKAAEPADTPLPEEDQTKIPVLQKMEEMFPKQYKGITEKFTSAKKALLTYASKWEAEHPGQEFDDSDPEHADFMAKHFVDWDDDHYIDAFTEIKLSRKMAEVTKPVQDKLTALERKETLREKAAEVAQEQTVAAQTFWSQHGDDYAGFIRPDGTVDGEKAKALREADPIAFDIRIEAAKALDAETSEIYKILNGLVDYDEKNQVHANMGQFAYEMERDLAAKPTDEKLDGQGRSFLPAAQFYKLSKQEREVYYWTLTARDIAAYRAADLARKTRKMIELEEAKHIAWAKARGIEVEPKSGKSATAPAAGDDGRLAGNDGKPNTPSIGGDSRMEATRRGSAADAGNPLASFVLRGL